MSDTGKVVPFSLTADLHEIVDHIDNTAQLERHFWGLLRKAPYDASAKDPEGSLRLYLDAYKKHSIHANLSIYRHPAFSTAPVMPIGTIMNSLLRDGLKETHAIYMCEHLWRYLQYRGYELRTTRLSSARMARGGQLGTVSMYMIWTPTRGGFEHVCVRVAFPDCE